MQPHRYGDRLTIPMNLSALARVTSSMLVIGLISGCAAPAISPGGSNAGEPDATSTAPSSTRAPFDIASPLPTESAIDVPDGVPAAIWPLIVEALEAETDRSIDASDVELVSVEAVTWNDGSLGCGKPGEVYTQALVDGFRVVVEVDGHEYDYRVPQDGEPRLCESDLPPGG